LLETMRAYGREHLLAGGELETVRGRHANFVVSRLQRMAEHLLGPDEDTVAARMAELLPDAVVAQEWLLDRQDWSGAEWCCWAGAYREERAFHEMHERLYHAMTSAGEEGRRYDRVAGNSRPQLETLDPEQVNELSWRWLRSEVTDDEQPHHTGAGAEPRTEDEVVELLRLAERRPEWPLVLRMYRRWCALRNIVRRGFSIPDGELERFEADADAADSADARVMAVEVRAQVAVAERRWRDAADWFERVIDGTAHRTTAIRTIATWARINCLAVAGDSPTSHELVDRWDEELATWGLPGSRSGVATAVALGAAGRRDLAERFVWWARDADPYALDVHRSWMELVGLGEPPIDSSPDAIDDLLDELRALADRSDVETARSAE
jgi:hypothetical protein